MTSSYHAGQPVTWKCRASRKHPWLMHPATIVTDKGGQNVTILVFRSDETWATKRVARSCVVPGHVGQLELL